MTAEERLVRELILQLKLGGVDRGYFQEKFGVDIVQQFAEPLGSLADAGQVAIANDRVVVTRQGLLRIDELLHGFSLPQHRTARYT